MPADPAGPATALKIMTLRRDDRCACGAEIAAGERAGWNRSTRTVVCLPCASADAVPAQGPPRPATPESTAIDLGQAGASAQAEFARRHDKREAGIRTAHPRIGGLILALTDDPQSTRAWASGAAGEARFAAAMAELGDAVIALHDRRVPRSRANIDHIVIGPSGIFVVDAKRYKDASINVRRTGGLFSQVREQLMVGGRDKTKLVEAMTWQVDAVRTALSGAPEFADVPVIAALCFIDGQFPLFGTLQMSGVEIKGLRGIAKLVTRDGPLDAAARERVAQHFADQLPAKAT
jgi:Nuclease-related domain